MHILVILRSIIDRLYYLDFALNFMYMETILRYMNEQFISFGRMLKNMNLHYKVRMHVNNVGNGCTVFLWSKQLKEIG